MMISNRDGIDSFLATLLNEGTGEALSVLNVTATCSHPLSIAWRMNLKITSMEMSAFIHWLGSLINPGSPLGRCPREHSRLDLPIRMVESRGVASWNWPLDAERTAVEYSGFVNT